MVIDISPFSGGTARGLAGGTCYLIKATKPDPAYVLLEGLLAEGRPGMVVSRRHPDRLREERPGLRGCRLLWLSHTPGEGHVSPMGLQNLTHTVTRFLEENPQGALLLDGLEALASNNRWEQVLPTLEAIHEFVMTRQAIVLVPVHPGAFDAREMALLERTLAVYELPSREASKPLDPLAISHLLDHY